MELTQQNRLVLLVAAGLVLVLLAAFLRRRTDGPGTPNTFARFFLVLLRVSIGWHFLVEGLDKYHNPGWTSEPYLREATGPLAPKFREIAGDRVVEQLTLGEGKTFPAALEQEWQRHLDAVTHHVELTAKQKEEASRVFDQSKSNTLTWFLRPQGVAKPAALEPKIIEELDVLERLKRLRDLQVQAEKIEAELPERGKKAWKEWIDAKASATKYRADLKKDLDGQTKAFKDAIQGILTPEQKGRGPAPDLPRPIDWNRQLDVADNVVKFGLIGVGAGLILGAFTRLAAFLGAVLLIMFFVAMPPLPYLPESPRAEGHYLYINKNIIEALALLALAFLPTGRWAGVDGLLQFLNPLNWRRAPSPGNVKVDRRLEAAARR